MTTPIPFGYRLFGTTGTCYGVTVSQAIDNAKVRYIRATQGIGPSHPMFRKFKAQLSGAPVLLVLTQEVYQRFRTLYKAKKDGDLLSSEDAELKALTQIVCDPHVRNEFAPKLQR